MYWRYVALDGIVRSRTKAGRDGKNETDGNDYDEDDGSEAKNSSRFRTKEISAPHNQTPAP